jgi:hypothetical protein
MDIIGPTLERLSKLGEWETPQTDKKAKRLHHRIISVVEGMHRRGWVEDEQFQAFLRFERDLNKADRVRLPMCQYGRPFYCADSSDNPWGPLDDKTAAVFRVREASVAIGHPNMVRAVSIAATQECTLESIGRIVAGEGNKTAAIAAGKLLMQLGTYRLAVHYQFIRGP